MLYRSLGRTDLNVSVIAMGCGPVSGLMTDSDLDRQIAVVDTALAHSVNWFDTAPGYGQGSSERQLGLVFPRISTNRAFHIATKVRLPLESTQPVGAVIRESVAASRARLGNCPITLLQLHNAITTVRGSEPFSLSVEDVLGPGGVADHFDDLRREGQIGWLGLTGTGEPAALRAVIRSGRFDTIQTPYHLLNPSSGRTLPAEFPETNLGSILHDCLAQQMGGFAIRVYAGGALLDAEPSTHTLTTPFFPLALYERDRHRARVLREHLPPTTALSTAAVQFALAHPAIHAALIGFGSPDHISTAIAAANAGSCVDPWDDPQFVTQMQSLPEN